MILFRKHFYPIFFIMSFTVGWVKTITQLPLLLSFSGVCLHYSQLNSSFLFLFKGRQFTSFVFCSIRKHQASAFQQLSFLLVNTNQPGTFISEEKEKKKKPTCFLFYAFTLTSMFSPLHSDTELGCPGPGCNVPDHSRLFYVNTNSSLWRGPIVKNST